MSIFDPAELRARLSALIAEHQTPGAAVGILHDGKVTEAAAGIVNLNTRVEVTPDTVFQIGSTGKTWTTTVLMQLVDEGLADIDVPVRTYLPDFAVADPDVSARVTLRHLLCHTSGIDGDHFMDTGRGDDAIRRYVESCAQLRQTHPLGATMSYCNTGFPVIGRVIEVLTGKVWDDAMRERLFVPLGLTCTSTLPEEAIMHRVAVGHVSPAPGAPLQVAPVWMLYRSCGPMGIINSTVREVLAFARLHLEHGRTPDGQHVLSADSVRAMQEPQVKIPDPYVLGSHWGLGTILFDWDGHRLYGHDGGTIGQSCKLRILPEANFAITLVANANDGQVGQIYRSLCAEVFAELGIAVPALPQPPATPPGLDLTRYAGIYERLSTRYDLAVDDGRLAGTETLSGAFAELGSNPVTKVTLTPVDAATFLIRRDGETEPEPAVFYEFDDGVPRYLHNHARANRRVRA